MKIKKIAALLMALVLVFVCTSCATIEVVIPSGSIPVVNQGNNGGGTPAPTPTPADPAAPTTPAAPADPAAPTEPAAPADPNAPAAPGVPSTKEEIVKLYETAYNKIATESKAVIRTYDYTNNYKDILRINDNKTLEGIASKLMTKFMVENKEEAALSVKDLPPKGFDKITLNPANFASATCVDKGSYYEVTLTSIGTDAKPETDSPAGTGAAGSICPILDPKDVTDATGGIIKFEGLHTLYSDAKATAKIDKATGRATEYAFLTPSVLHFDSVTAVVVTVKNCDIGLLFHQNWKINY